MRYLLGLVVGLAGLWLLLSGHYTSLVMSLGAASCAVVVFLCHRMGLIDDESVPLHLLPRLPGYLLWLAAQIASSNWDVAWRIVRPGRRISPTMVNLHAHQRTQFGQVVYANSITLTPGTVTVGLRDGHAEVHALTRDNAEDLEAGSMDARACALEGESGSPRTTKGA